MFWLLAALLCAGLAAPAAPAVRAGVTLPCLTREAHDRTSANVRAGTVAARCQTVARFSVMKQHEQPDLQSSALHVMQAAEASHDLQPPRSISSDPTWGGGG